MFDIVFYIFAGFLADLALADPRGWPHPVRWLGGYYDFWESRCRGLNLDPLLCGAAGVILLCLLVCIVVVGLISLPVIGWFFGLYLAYSGLALGGLIREGKKVLGLLEQGDLSGAREALAMLVSRDTSGMDKEEINASLAETLSENFNDAFCAPLFYLALLGPAGLWVYKAVSTGDSMWGYKNERFERLGKFAARADDLLAWIPARISAFLFVLCARMLPGEKKYSLGSVGEVWGKIAKDARRAESPNAGWCMSAAAHTLGFRLGGPAKYFGEIKDKPYFNQQGACPGIKKQKELIRLMYLSGFVFVGAICAVFLLLGLVL
ncbi:MAG: adenosylcobinamide-phosphate synthase CbiB [Thermodesulfobacteriota bacterium]